MTSRSVPTVPRQWVTVSDGASASRVTARQCAGVVGGPEWRLAGRHWHAPPSRGGPGGLRQEETKWISALMESCHGKHWQLSEGSFPPQRAASVGESGASVTRRAGHWHGPRQADPARRLPTAIRHWPPEFHRQRSGAQAAPEVPVQCYRLESWRRWVGQLGVGRGAERRLEE